MKLSEAIRLGSLLVPNPEEGWLGGCAITMALKAVSRFDMATAYEILPDEWPWLKSVRPLSIKCPCPPCPVLLPVYLIGEGGFRDPYSSLLFHAFDVHVCEGEMSIEQLADFIASIEPPDSSANTALESRHVQQIRGELKPSEKVF
jgi:hypothetical protein